MLSYRHAFHAGNHADVLKHFVLFLVLDYFNQKEKPYWMIDTHAGAGLYSLESGYSAQNAEWKSGISKLRQAKNLPPFLQAFMNAAEEASQHNSQLYAGSPKIAHTILRPTDKLRLFELHPTDNKILQENFAAFRKQVQIELKDGFEGIKACLPPPTKRAMVLIDPPYEIKDDYKKVVACLKDSLKRFSTGTFLVWYPLLARPEPAQMVESLKQLLPDNWLALELNIHEPSDDGHGMFGSGMFVINPPWTLPTVLQESIPQLCELLAYDNSAGFTMQHKIS